MIIIYFVVNTCSCDGVCIVCITWIYTREDFISCALVVLNGIAICKIRWLPRNALLVLS